MGKVAHQIHAHRLLVNDHHVQHCVAKGVLGIRVSAVVNQKVVDFLAAPACSKRQRVLPVVTEACSTHSQTIDPPVSLTFFRTDPPVSITFFRIDPPVSITFFRTDPPVSLTFFLSNCLLGCFLGFVPMLWLQISVES